MVGLVHAGASDSGASEANHLAISLQVPAVANPRTSARVSWSPIGQSSQRENCDNRATGDGIDFMNGLGANVVVDYHEQ